MDTPEDESSLWDRYMPRDVQFFRLTMFDQFRRRPYHAIDVEGPFNLKKLIEENRAHAFRSESNLNRNGSTKTVRLLLKLAGDVYAYLEDELLKVYAPTPEAAQAAAKQFQRYVKPSEEAKPCFYMVSIMEQGPYAEPVVIERPAPITVEELAMNYGADFPAWETHWTARLQRTPSGLTIFHGPPGCGKTSYLRALMARLLGKAVFYFLPVSEADILSNPRFVSFWMRQTNQHPKKIKIVLLEDAEDLLLPRDVGNRDKVSNLLNLADGFMGDHLKLHVIATTNAAVRQLDPAILRPGRLVGAREFRRLTRVEAQQVAQCKGLTLSDQDSFSLAEVYCGTATGPAFQADRQIGFAQ